MKESGILYLIPTTLGNTDPSQTISLRAQEAVRTIDLFVVERPKSAMRFLGRMGIGDRLEGCTLVPIDQLGDGSTLAQLLEELDSGKDVGVLSEAGCPGVADPGAEIVRAAQARELPVVPLVGPSSILLGLMASGMNGQEFAFHGYLPIERQPRVLKLRAIEQSARMDGQTQIFIEAPHRNDHLLGDILTTCRGDTMLCVALDLTLPAEYIRTKAISAWKRNPVTIGKRPAIFLLGRWQG
ncbi:MAG TPA: SAM-dependent methyltransferase [Spirochaetia bacterium]|nr:SAM-dependent methyltransferase [Spirochaetia bacterium]